MTEKWNQFVYDLCDAQQRDVDENEYHRLIETQFQLLGWAKYRGEICHKPNIPIGNNNFIQPDILMKRDGEELFVIEVKRPIHSISQREIQQLESYMRQRKIKFGVYIGEHIELFYDKPESTEAVSVLIIPLELNNKFGELFVELFGKDRFSSNSLTEFCEKRISEKQQELKKIEAQKYLVANGEAIVTDKLKQYLKNDCKDSFSEEEIEEIMSGLTISVLPKTVLRGAPLPSVSSIRDMSLSTISINVSKKPAGKPAKYSLNGSPFLAANRFVFEVVKAYVSQHPEMTFSELERVFDPLLQGSCGVIRSLDYLRQKNYKGQRFFDDTSSILRSGDGVEFAVCTQWSYHNTPDFAAHARKLGFSVETT